MFVHMSALMGTIFPLTIALGLLAVWHLTALLFTVAIKLKKALSMSTLSH